LSLVVKLGGAAASGDALAVLCEEVAALTKAGTRLYVVHGGGPQTSELQKALGQPVKRVAGRRVTDEAALDALKMTVGGKLNIDICAALLRAGARPVGLHGASALALEATRRPARSYPGHPEPVDLGLVGDVVGVNKDLYERLHAGGYVPVVACIGAAPDGAVYNINADAVANRMAVELGAEALVLVSDTRGVLRDVADPSSRIVRMSESEARRAIDSGAVTEGMIAKLEEAFEAILAGVPRIHVVGQLGPGELRRELEQPGSVGTVLVP
jgi:acetylglutamate kinase